MKSTYLSISIYDSKSSAKKTSGHLLDIVKDILTKPQEEVTEAYNDICDSQGIVIGSWVLVEKDTIDALDP